MGRRFLHNHVGFDARRRKTVLVDVTDAPHEDAFTLHSATGAVCLRGTLTPAVPSFRGRALATADISDAPPGRYTLDVAGDRSTQLFVSDDHLLNTTLDAVLSYFRQQRCQAPWDNADRAVPFFGGRAGSVDAHGGWYDASGDVSKYLSHLSYANFMNPQQTPLVVWGLLEHFERRAGKHAPGVAARLLDEARHGAEFLCRMQDPAGYFYMTVFDRWSKDPGAREICAYRTQRGEKLASYQAAYRQGGGVTIAALARAARLLRDTVGEREAGRFLAAAERGFAHLEAHNLEYLDDGRENIIDDYCALLAATELAATTHASEYRRALWERAERLVARVQSDGALPGWLRADEGARPFFHAAEAGLPALALLRASELCAEPGRAELLRATVGRLLRFELAVTAEVSNPYGYARQLTQDAQGRRQTAYFIPHDNETGYWWQGENARLASLAAAAGLYCTLTNASVASDSASEVEHAALRSYAFDQLDWILGKNPFDACMLHGFGRNNHEYLPHWPNCPGGICNGVTSGALDEQDVDFARTEGLEGDHSWRWAEQWLPHAAWYLVALAELSS